MDHRPTRSPDRQKTNKISCIVLAAGESRRFGSPKPLAKIAGQTVIERVCRTLLASQADEVIVVLGADASLIRPCVPKDARLKITLNDAYRQGQTSSLKAGLAVISRATLGFMVLPADTPFVKSETINSLVASFLKNKTLILLPTHAGKNGHPPVFSRELRREFLALNNDQPLFTVQRLHQADTLLLPVEDAGVGLSFNTPEELEKLKTIDDRL